jgi:hypothetical protein
MLTYLAPLGKPEREIDEEDTLPARPSIVGSENISIGENSFNFE